MVSVNGLKINQLLGICGSVRITRSATVASGRATPPAGLVITSTLGAQRASALRLRVATSCVLRGGRSGDAAIERCETRSTHDNTPCTPWPLEPHRAPNRMVMDGAAAYRPSTIPSDRRASSRHAWQQGPMAMPRSSDHRPACLAGRGTGLPISRVPCPRHRPRPTLVGPHMVSP